MSSAVLLSLLPLASYAFVMSITPGPNNLLLASSGLRFGFAKTVPHWLGVNAGFITLLILCSIGIGALITKIPILALGLKAFGTIYLLGLAWVMRSNAFEVDDIDAGKPIGFIAAALFQFVNPKAWVMTISASSAFLPNLEPYWLAITLFVSTFIIVGMPCGAAWLLTGVSLKRVLNSPRSRSISAWIMLLLILASAMGIWL